MRTRVPLVLLERSGSAHEFTQLCPIGGLTPPKRAHHNGTYCTQPPTPLYHLHSIAVVNRGDLFETMLADQIELVLCAFYPSAEDHKTNTKLVVQLVRANWASSCRPPSSVLQAFHCPV